MIIVSVMDIEPKRIQWRRRKARFMSMAITKGLDAAIPDPLDKRMMVNILTAEALAGKDRFCMNYIKAYQEGWLELT